MIPGLGGMNPRQMERMMQQMGIDTKAIDATEVIIKKKDGSEMVITSPQVTLIDMQGQKSFQISGDVTERAGGPSEDDIRLVMEQAKCTREKALAALKETKGDIAAAILKLQE